MRYVLAAALTVLLAACDTSARAAETNPMYAEGLRVYHEQYCGTCHSLPAAETGGMFGPPHDSIALVAERRVGAPGYHGTATTAEEYLRESVTDPGAFRVPGYEMTRFMMPAYTTLSEQELDALVYLMLNARAPDGGSR